MFGVERIAQDLLGKFEPVFVQLLFVTFLFKTIPEKVIINKSKIAMYN